MGVISAHARMILLWGISAAILLMLSGSRAASAQVSADAGHPLSAGAAPTPVDTTHLTDTVIQAIRQSKDDSTRLLVVDKSIRRMFLYESGRLDTIMKIALGREPLADKERAWDGRTPEGSFHIRMRTNEPLSSFYKSLTLDYPLPEDAERGKEAGMIDRVTYERIMTAHQEDLMPDQLTSLGGEYLHSWWRLRTRLDPRLYCP